MRWNYSYNNRCLFFRRLKINHEFHEFILESGTVANIYNNTIVIQFESSRAFRITIVPLFQMFCLHACHIPNADEGACTYLVEFFPGERWGGTIQWSVHDCAGMGPLNKAAMKWNMSLETVQTSWKRKKFSVPKNIENHSEQELSRYGYCKICCRSA